MEFERTKARQRIGVNMGASGALKGEQKAVLGITISSYAGFWWRLRETVADSQTETRLRFKPWLARLASLHFGPSHPPPFLCLFVAHCELSLVLQIVYLFPVLPPGLAPSCLPTREATVARHEIITASSLLLHHGHAVQALSHIAIRRNLPNAPGKRAPWLLCQSH